MKYKLISNKEEHLCDKVTIDGFDYYVSDEIPEEGGFSTDGLGVFPFHSENPCQTIIFNPKKVIATNNPNIDIPKVVDEVEKYFNDIPWSSRHDMDIWSYKEGYNKSQETHPFNEEDMIEFGKWIALNCYRFIPNYKGEDKTTWWDEGDLNNPKRKNAISTEELLAIWKEQQPKIIYYESK